MKNRTVIIILSLAAALLLFIVFVERDMMTSTQIDDRKDRVFVDFDKTRVDELTIKKADAEPVTLKRKKNQGDGGDTWQILSPRALEADQGEVRVLLSAIDFLLIGRTIDDPSLKKDPKYGLVPPRISVSYGSADQKTTFHIGAETQDEKVYLALEGKDTVFYAVEGDFLESFDKNLDDLRSRKVFQGSLALASGLVLQNGAEQIELGRRDEGGWKISAASQWITAAEDQVSQLIQTLGDVEAESFVADNVDEKGLDTFGLDNPSMFVKIDLPGDKTQTLGIGNVCPGSENTRYVSLLGTGSVVCAKDDFLIVLGRPQDRFVEKRLAVFNKDEISELTVSAGQKQLTFQKNEAEWQFSKKDLGEVEQKSVSDLLDMLGTLRAEEIQIGESAATSLGAPQSQIILGTSDNRPQAVLKLFPAAGGTSLHVRRGEEMALLTISPELLEKVRPNHLAFLKRTIKVFDPDKLERLEIEAPVSQTLVKKDGLWRLVKPLDAPSDGMAVRNLGRLLGSIDVVEFRGTGPEKQHGFESPHGVITAHFAVEQNTPEGQNLTQTDKAVLEIGAPAGDQGRYARLRRGDTENQLIFIVGQPYLTALETPLVARDLMRVPESNLGSITFQVADKKVEVKREGTRWVLASGHSPDPDKLGQIIADLEATKTVRAHNYQIDEASFAEPTLIIEAVPSSDNSKDSSKDSSNAAEETAADTFVFGPKSPSREEDGYLAAKRGRGVTFVYPARVVDEILSFVAAVSTP